MKLRNMYLAIVLTPYGVGVLLVLAGYFQLDGAILLKQLDQVLLIHVPWETAKEDFTRVDGVL